MHYPLRFDIQIVKQWVWHLFFPKTEKHELILINTVLFARGSGLGIFSFTGIENQQLVDHTCCKTKGGPAKQHHGILFAVNHF